MQNISSFYIRVLERRLQAPEIESATDAVGVGDSVQLHVPVVYKQCSVLVCFLQNGSSNWFGCIPADSYVINRFFFQTS